MKNKKFFLSILIGLQTTFLLGSELSTIEKLKQNVKEHTLKNGLKVLILERHIAPLVSFQMMFRTGAVDEISGKTGLAHFFEHMMFKGTQTIGTKNFAQEKPILLEIDRIAREIIKEEDKGNQSNPEILKMLKQQMHHLETEHQKWIVTSEFEELYQQEGGQGLNAFTGQDMTGFVINLPSNKWELWPLLESDRMKNPVLREFYKERDVVMEERRMRYENSAQGKLWENFISIAYQAHPYGSPTIGWMSDLKHLTLSDAEDFFQQHYAPNNATVAIVGDIDENETLSKIEQYFAQVDSQTLKTSHMTTEPEQEGERRSIVYFDSEPSLLIGFHKPNPPHPDNWTIQMIEELLTRGRTSRFHRNIIEKKIAISAWGDNGNPGERYPNLIVFGGSPQAPYNNLDVEKYILNELEKLKNEKVSENELQKIRNQIEADFIRGLGSNDGMASELVYMQTVLGNWKYLFDYLDGIQKITPEQIQQTAKKYFTAKNRTVSFLQKEPQ